MNEEAIMPYRGRALNHEDLKRVNLVHGGIYEKVAKRWGGKYLGIPKAHPYKLYGVLSDILDENPQIKGIIEVGTYYGALSCYLGAECIERGLKPLMTIDNKIWYEPKKIFDALKVDFVVGDCFSEEVINEIKKYLEVGAVLFICDGGNKSREFNTFAPMLPKGSVIGVHDWMLEVNYEGIGNTINDLMMTEYKKEEWLKEPDIPAMAFFKKPDDWRGEKDNMEKEGKPRVFVGIPTTGFVRQELMRWCLGILRHPDYNFTFYPTKKSTIQHNRNFLVNEFLKSDAEWFLTVDSDVAPPLNIMEVIKDTDKDIIAPVNMVWKSWGLAPLISMKTDKGYRVTDYDKAMSKDTLVEVDGTGTTCLFIRRKVLEEMKPPWFEFIYDENGLLTVGEDYRFCEKAKELGYKIWIDKRFITHHFTGTSLKSVNEEILRAVERERNRDKEGDLNGFRHNVCR